MPYVGRKRLSEACIRKWMRAHKKHGKVGLEPKLHSDAGTCRALSQTELAILTAALEAQPKLTAAAVVEKLRQEDRISSQLSSSSLSRLVCSLGLTREQRRRKAILLAFIDDATRKILYTSFSVTERSVEFEAGIKHILAAHGRIGRLYVDNGSSLVGLQTKRIVDSLGLLLIHSRPHIPRGRGKIERFFRTAREQFFAPLDSATITDLGNLTLRFHEWVEAEYHRSPHRGLSNVARWLEDYSSLEELLGDKPPYALKSIKALKHGKRNPRFSCDSSP